MLKEISRKCEYEKSYEVMRELADHLTKDEYLARLYEMLEYGYRMYVLTDKNDNYLSIVGFTIQYDFFNGKHLWINELSTLKKYRSLGYGAKLIKEVESLAKKEKCKKVILYSGLSRELAHNFWLNHMNYEKRGIVFKKEI